MPSKVMWTIENYDKTALTTIGLWTFSLADGCVKQVKQYCSNSVEKYDELRKEDSSQKARNVHQLQQ